MHRETFTCGSAPYPWRKRGQWWIALDGDRPAGFAGIVKSTLGEDYAYLARAAVLKPYRGQGLQKRLIRVRTHWARKHGFKYVVTDTSEDNHASANSLITCGFRLFEPPVRWGTQGANHWRLVL